MRTHARNSLVMDQMNRYEKTLNNNTLQEWVRDQSYIKQYNIQTVLAVLKKYQPISRTDAARLTSMSPTSITRIVSALLSQGLICETGGEARSGRGRKATHLRIQADGIYALGVHLEKSVVRLCVTDFADEVLYRGEALVDGECTIEQMARTAKELYDRISDDIVPDRSRVKAVGICPSEGMPSDRIREAFSEAFGMTACVESNVRSCLIGEKVRMKIPDEVDTAYLLIGSELSMAATSGGLIVRGKNHAAGRIASVPIKGNGTGADNLSMHLTEEHLIRRARRFASDVHSTDGILWAYRQDQPWAKELLTDFTAHLRMTLTLIDGVLAPEKIILGGSVFSRFAPCVGELTDGEHVIAGGQYEAVCMSGAASVAMRTAVIDMIGQSIE